MMRSYSLRPLEDKSAMRQGYWVAGLKASPVLIDAVTHKDNFGLKVPIATRMKLATLSSAPSTRYFPPVQTAFHLYRFR